MLFPGNLDLLSETLGGPVGPLVCGFIGRDNLRAWRELFMNLYKLKSRIWFLAEYIHFEYADLTDFHEISREHSRDNDKPKCVGKFWYLTHFPRGVHLRNTSCIFLATLTLEVDI